MHRETAEFRGEVQNSAGLECSGDFHHGLLVPPSVTPPPTAACTYSGVANATSSWLAPEPVAMSTNWRPSPVW